MELLSPSLSHYSTLSSLLALGVGFLLLRILQTHIYSPLKKFPGPFLGSLTDWWRLVYSYRILHSSQPWIDIHRKYGDIVRLGPDMLSFGSAEAARDIYGAGKNFKKVDAESWLLIFRGINSLILCSSQNSTQLSLLLRKVSLERQSSQRETSITTNLIGVLLTRPLVWALCSDMRVSWMRWGSSWSQNYVQRSKQARSLLTCTFQCHPKKLAKWIGVLVSWGAHHDEFLK